MLENIRPSVDEIALENIVNKRIAERFPDHTSEILETLDHGTNKDFAQKIKSYIEEEQGKIGLERLHSSMNMHLWDKDLQTATIIPFSSNPSDLSSETIDKITYDKLLEYSQNFSELTAEVEAQIDTNKVF